MNENTKKLAQDLKEHLEEVESLKLHMLWADQTEEEDLTPQQREDNRRFREWVAKHPGDVTGKRLKWNDEVADRTK